MQTPKKVLLISVVAIAVIAMAFVFLKNSRKGPGTEGAPSNDAYMIELENNRAALKSFLDGGKIEDAMIYRSVIQLAEVKDPVALRAALTLKDSDSRYSREGAAQALGWFDDVSAMAGLKQLLNDKEPSVRTFAVQGLGRGNSAERQTEINTLIDNEKLSPTEAVALREAIFRGAKQDSDRKDALTSLERLTANSNTELASIASLKMIELAPESESTRNMLRKKIEEARDPQVMGTGIRTLSSQNDPWIRTRLAYLASNSDPMVRKAVIQSLHRVCPTDRWTILESLLKSEAEVSVIEVALDEAVLLPEKQAPEFFDKALRFPNVVKFAKERAEENRKKLAAGGIPNPCASAN